MRTTMNNEMNEKKAVTLEDLLIPQGIGAKIPEMPVVELPDTAGSIDSNSAHSDDSGEEVVLL